MNEVVVRKGKEQDANDIYRLVPLLAPLTVHTSYTYWNLFRNFGDSCFIAADGKEPVGFITSHPTTTPKSEWFIWQAGILPEYRGTGIIDTLQDRVIDIALSSGATALNTSIEIDNLRSLGAFNRMAVRLGTTMEEIGRYYPTSEDFLASPEVLYRIALSI